MAETVYRGTGRRKRSVARVMIQSGQGRVMVNGRDGYVILSHAGPHAVLVVLARKDSKLGLIFLDMGRAAKSVEEALK